MRAFTRCVRRFMALAFGPLLLACAEGTGPESLGQLRLKPVFAVGEEPGVLGISVSHIRVQLRRADGIMFADTLLSYAAGETTSWLLDLDAPPESVSVNAIIGQGTATMYAGAGRVLMSAGIGPSSTHHDLPVRYLGETGSPFSIHISPDSVGLASSGVTQQFSAVARDESGAELTGFSFSWSSTRPDVATVNSTTGLVTTVGNGRAEITATSGGVTDTAIVTVGVVATRIVVEPESLLVFVGGTRRFLATAYDRHGNVVPGVVFSWKTLDNAVARIDSTGLATAKAVGETRVVASSGALADSAILKVIDSGTGPRTASIVVIPPVAVLTTLGDSLQFTAIARDTLGNVMNGVVFSWTSSDPDVATVSANGQATAVSQGTVTIQASALGLTGFATLTVTQMVKSVVVVPPHTSIVSGASQQFSAVARDGNGHIVPNATFTWATTNPAVASITAAGMAKGLSHGSTHVHATSHGVTGVAFLDVVTVGSITIEGAFERAVAVGATTQFKAIVRDVAGNILTGVAVTWSVSAPAFASIDPVTGLTAGLQKGWTFVRVAFGNLTDEVELLVIENH